MCIRFTWPKFGLQAYETRNQNKNNYNSLKIENKRFHGPDPNQSINQHIIGVPEQFRHATKHLIEDAGKCKEKYRTKTEIINMHEYPAGKTDINAVLQKKRKINDRFVSAIWTAMVTLLTR